MGPLTRAVQTGIGLVAELKVAREERKGTHAGDDSVSTGKHNWSPHLTARSDLIVDIWTGVENLDLDKKDEDEDEWEDDLHFGGAEVASDGFDPTLPVDEPPPYSEEELASISDVKYPEPISPHGRPKLSCPVVIPQRRPGSKGRGFLRAYAPVLADHDLDEQTFLTFLKSFHKASQVR